MIRPTSSTAARWMAGAALIAALAGTWLLVRSRPAPPALSVPRAAADRAEPAQESEPLVAPPPDVPRASPEAEPEPAPAPEQPTHVESTLGWLRRVLPERYGALTERELASLTELDLNGAQISDADLAQLGSLPNLRILGLRGTPITDAGLAHLAALPLTSLDLRGTSVTSYGMLHLPAGTLEALHITDSQVAGTELYRLPRMPHLAVLKLNRLQELDDAAIEALSVFPVLRHVELDGTQVSERGLERLLALNPEVKRVELRFTPVSDASLEALRARYPGCEFVKDEAQMIGLPRGG
jgi:hypothetical protein